MRRWRWSVEKRGRERCQSERETNCGDKLQSEEEEEEEDEDDDGECIHNEISEREREREVQNRFLRRRTAQEDKVWVKPKSIK
jgi:hypothetical protein